MIKWKFTIIICFLFVKVYSQHLTAFIDYRQHFMVFDKGITKELDHLPVQSYQIGGAYIAFISNSGQLKVYHKGEINILTEHSVSNYFASSCLLVYQAFGQLFVFDDGKISLLANYVNNFALSDSLVAFFDENKYSTHVYYKGKIFDLEKSLVGAPVQEFKVGDNILAYYNSNTKYLKAFYLGKVWDVLQSASSIEYQLGRDMLAYIDKAKNSFHLFYKAEIIDLEDYEPKSMKVGDDLLAYIDNLGAFKVFYNGETRIISSFEPDFYQVKDSLMVFAEQGYFKVFYKGKVYDLENYIPEKYQMQESTLAFVGMNGWLEAFTNGEFIKVTNDLTSSYFVSYNLITINTTLDKMKVFYHGKMYDTY